MGHATDKPMRFKINKENFDGASFVCLYEWRKGWFLYRYRLVGCYNSEERARTAAECVRREERVKAEFPKFFD
jgi:hypothetical protein